MTDVTPVGSHSDGEPYYDPFSREINANPHAAFKRLRDERPLYYNERYDFYAVSRFDDVQEIRLDTDTFINGLGSAPLERIPNTGLARRVLIEMDPPEHKAYRSLTNRSFTPKAVGAFTDAVREMTVECIDPFVGAGPFDYIQDFAKHIPMRTTCLLLGIHGEDQEELIELFEEREREFSKLVDVGDYSNVGDAEAKIRERLIVIGRKRRREPQEDLISVLAHAELKDPDSGTRALTDAELGEYCLILFQGGNNTTLLLMSWVTWLLGEHPDQRKILLDDPDLTKNGIEEILRFEPVSHVQGRVTSRDVEIRGETVPEGSKVFLLTGAASRDERRFDDPDVFDVRRDAGNHMAFGWGIHACIGAHLARLEARIVLEETLKRFPDWTIDQDRAEMQIISTLRGYHRLPFHP